MPEEQEGMNWVGEEEVDTRELVTKFGAMQGVTVRGLRKIINDPGIDPDTLAVMAVQLSAESLATLGQVAEKNGGFAHVMCGIGLIYNPHQDITLLGCHATGITLKERGLFGSD